VQTENKCIECRIKSNAASVLSDCQLVILEEGCTQMNFKKGDLIIKEGMPAQFVVFVRHGFIKISKKGLGGKDTILSISKKGAYIGIQNLNLKNGLNYFTASAITETGVCLIKIECFKKLLLLNGVFATEVISYIFDDEMNYFDRLVNNIQQQLPGRIAGSLLYFSQEIYISNSFDLNITKSELASLVGSSREAVSRILKEFHETGIIVMERDKIKILNIDRLQTIKMKG
jgi:CRP/FNR family transcriptional regulator